MDETKARWLNGWQRQEIENLKYYNQTYGHVLILLSGKIALYMLCELLQHGNTRVIVVVFDAPIVAATLPAGTGLVHL